MNNIDDDPKPFVPPISPEILQTSTKDEHERLIKWEISGEVKLTGGETYRTEEDKQPRLPGIPLADENTDKRHKLRKSVSFDIPKVPSAPPLSPEPPAQPTITGKPPVSPRRTLSQPAAPENHIIMYNNNTGSPPTTGAKCQVEDEFNFGRMRFRQVGVTIESKNNSGEERVPTPPSAPKPFNQNVSIDEQNGGKVRRQWQRDSAELVIVTQNDTVSPRTDVTTVQAPPSGQYPVKTTDSTVQKVHRDAMLQEQAKQQVVQQEILKQQMQQQLVKQPAQPGQSSTVMEDLHTRKDGDNSNAPIVENGSGTQ